MQAKHVYTLQEKRLLMDCLIINEPKVLNMLKEREEELFFSPELRKRWSEQGLMMVYDFEMPIEKDTQHPILILAAKFNNAKIVAELVRQGADVNTPGSNDFTALHFAAERGLDDIVKLLIHHRAAIEQQNEYGDTPLHCAALNGNLSTAEILLAFGASMSATNDDGDTPIKCAENRKHTQMKSAWIRSDGRLLQNNTNVTMSFSSPFSAPTYPYQPIMNHMENYSVEYMGPR